MMRQIVSLAFLFLAGPAQAAIELVGCEGVSANSPAAGGRQENVLLPAALEKRSDEESGLL